MPDAQGRFGKFGGKYVPETLMAALTELEVEFYKALDDQSFQVCMNSTHKSDTYSSQAEHLLSFQSCCVCS